MKFCIQCGGKFFAGGLCKQDYIRAYQQSQKFKKYQQSQKFKESQKKYQQSQKFKESQKKYRQSPEYKKRQKKYRQSQKYKEAQKKYQQSPKYKNKKNKGKTLYRILSHIESDAEKMKFIRKMNEIELKILKG